MKRWIRAVLLVVAVFCMACGDEAASSSPSEDTADTSLEDTAPPEDLYVPLPASDIEVTVEADVIEGNAPLTVHLNCKVTGAERDELDFLWKIGQQPSSLPELDFTFYVEGDFQACCTAWRKDGQANVVESCQLIRVRGSAELSITNPKLEGPSEVSQGDCVYASFDVRNNGAKVASSFDLQCVLSPNQEWDDESDKHIVLFSETIEGMEDGQYQTKSTLYEDIEMCIPGDVEDGPYFLLCKVDVNDEINETNKADNARFATTFITVDHTLNLHADLTIPTVGVIENQKFPKGWGDILTYNLTVTNLGEAESTQFVYEVYVCPADENGTVSTIGDDCEVISDVTGSKIYTLDPEVLIPIMRNWIVPDDTPNGTYCLAAKIDVNGQVNEENEDNNETFSDACFDVVYVEELGTDLGLSGLTCSPSDAYWGGNLFVEYQVTNNGTEPTPVWDYQIYMSFNPALTPATSYPLCSGTKCANQEAVQPGQTVTVSQVVSIPSDMPLSEYWCIVKVDVSGDIVEMDESNNMMSHDEKMTVTSKAYTDIFSQNVSFSPTTQYAGDTIKVTYSLGNNDISTAAGVSICVALSTDPTFSVSGVKNGSDVVISQFTVPEIKSGSVTEYTDKVTVPVALDHEDGGMYYLAVIADCEGSLKDDNPKSNNLSTASGTLTVLEPKGGCFEDAYDLGGQVNDDQALAIPLTAGVHSDLAICNNDDWYKVTVPATYSMTVTMTTEVPLWVNPDKADSSDIDLEIRDATGALLDLSNSTEAVEVADLFMAEEEAEYFIRVRPKGTKGKAHYSLDITLTPPIEGIDLRPVDLVATPAKTWAGGALFLQWDNVNLGTFAAGVYAISVVLSEDNIIDDSDMNLAVLPKEGMPATAIESYQETLLLPTDISTGDYYVGLILDSGEVVAEVNEGNNSILSDAFTIDGDNPCIDDTQFEPNNNLATATQLDTATNTYLDLVVCPYLDDWFKMDLEIGDKLVVDVTYQYKSASGFLYVELIDPTGIAILDEGKKANKSSVDIPYVWEAGTYYLRVYNPLKSGKAGPYSYKLDTKLLTSSSADVCVADVYENNNHYQFASNVGCGLREMTLCKQDVDWMQFELPPNSNVSLTLDNLGSKMKMVIYKDPEGTAYKTKTGNGLLTGITSGAEATKFYVKVQPRYTTTYPTNLDYTIFFDGIQGVDLEVKDVTTLNATVIQGEDDIVDFKVLNQCLDSVNDVPFALYLSADDTLDDTDVLIHEAKTKDPVPGGGELIVSEKFTVPYAIQPGVYKLIVSMDDSDEIEESNEKNNTAVGTLTILKTCLDDALEPNDHPLWAPLVESGDYDDLQICSMNVDWYQIALVAGDTLEVNLTFENSAGDLDMRFYEASEFNVPLLKAFETGDGEDMTFTAELSGVYYVRVNGLAGASNTYGMSIVIN